MRIGILCSIPEESKHFDLIANTSQKYGGRTFFKNKIKSNEIIIVECGIGKVNAAIVSTLLIQKFECDLLIFCGTGGGIDRTLEIGDVILGESIIQYDYGSIENDIKKVFRAGKIPLGICNKDIEFKIDSKIKKLIMLNLPDLKIGKIITGDRYVNCKNARKHLFEKFSAQVVDMESGAVVQVSEQFGIKSLIIRSISDFAENNLKTSLTNIKLASKNSFKTVKKILNII